MSPKWKLGVGSFSWSVEVPTVLVFPWTIQNVEEQSHRFQESIDGPNKN